MKDEGRFQLEADGSGSGGGNGRMRRRRTRLLDNNNASSVANPYAYWEDLEVSVLSNSSSYQRSGSSSIIWLPSSTAGGSQSENISEDGGVRLGRILTMLSSSLYGSPEQAAASQISAAMAARDFNLRRSPYWSGSSDIRYCNLHITVGFAPPVPNSPRDVARLYDALVLRLNVTVSMNSTAAAGGSSSSPSLLTPMAILAGTGREAAALLGILGSVTSPSWWWTESTSSEGDHQGAPPSIAAEADPDDVGVMIMSPIAASSFLDSIPMLARTITNTKPIVRALLEYLRSIKVGYLGVFYSNDVLGTSYLLDLQTEAVSYGIQIFAVSYSAKNLASSDSKAADASWTTTAAALDDADVLYWFGVLALDSWEPVVKGLHRFGLLGMHTHRVWFFDRTVLLGTGVTSQALDLANSSQALIVTALNRSVVVDIQVSNQTRAKLYSESFRETLEDPDFVEYWDELRRQQPWLASLQGVKQQADPDGDTAVYGMLAYDGVMASALGGCRTSNRTLFAGGQLLNETSQLRFQGATGTVHFDEMGTRDPEGLVFRVSNLFFLPSDESSNETTTGQQEEGANGRLSLVRAEVVTCFAYDPHLNQSIQVQPLTFPSGSTIPPPVTDASVVEASYVPIGISAVSWALAGIVMALSLAFAAWTIANRNNPQVRASQPTFLVLVCIGTLMVGVSMVLSSYQYYSTVSYCMVHAWLLSMGVSLVFAALFAKTWRIFQVFKSARRFRRVEIRAKDVMYPIVIICGLEIAVLTAWTVVDPLVFTRYPAEYDRFGNVFRTVEACMAPQITSTTQYIFFGVTAGISFFTLVVSSYQSYRARTLPTKFNESRYIAFSNLILVESFIVGGPVLFVSRDDPSSFSLVLNVLVAIMSLAVLLPVFVPKLTSASDIKNRRFVPTASSVAEGSASHAIESFATTLSRKIAGRRGPSDANATSSNVSRLTVSNVSSQAVSSRLPPGRQSSADPASRVESTSSA